MNCERCGEQARVHVLEGYSGGQAVRRFLCFRCADAADPGEVGAWNAADGGRRLPVATLVLSIGTILMLVGAFADTLHFWHGGSGEFGWLQRSVLGGGVLLLVIGALLRVDLVAVAGGLMFAIAIVADLYGTVGTPGIGWRQALLIVVGGLLAAAAAAFRKRHGGFAGVTPTAA